VLRLLASEIDGRGITVDLDLAPGLPSVQADTVLVQQVLLNLLDNACNAVVDKPAGERQLSLVTRTQGDAVLLEVTDNGSGLADPNRAFEPFYSTRPDGLGMGLTIVRSIVNSHGGRVSIESSPGRGTTTSVSLPVNGAAP
ncbi:MAG TPA: ATP-binding protein, partial [Woeseiaceae bacterium]|nr:ATP-binding protein [Woeseiaceae bacterium]